MSKSLRVYVSILISLEILIGIVAVLGGLVFMLFKSAEHTLFGDFIRAFVVGCNILGLGWRFQSPIINVVQFVLAYGYLKRKGWAWTIGFTFSLVGILWQLLLTIYVIGWIMGLAVNGLIIYWLRKPEVRKFFGKDVDGN